jgi:hypothetical protein
VIRVVAYTIVNSERDAKGGSAAYSYAVIQPRNHHVDMKDLK